MVDIQQGAGTQTGADTQAVRLGVRPGLIMCVCTGKCPGFEKMDIWDFINRVRIELPVEFGMIHPQLCEEDGDRFLADFLHARRPLVIAGCAPNMQYKLFRDAFAVQGMDAKKDMVPLDIRDMTTDEAVERVAAALRAMGVKDGGGDGG
jgi:heterodisulfide reductase subunit A-like polyferredoxin